jgi:uncharacterized SAM-binding protein YcdF (DUF218 family)
MAVEIARHSQRWKRRGRWQSGLLLLLLALLLIGGLAYLGVRRCGYWLIVSDPLAPAQAIVVLDGAVPFRAMEAASLYKQGWAPEVWVIQSIFPAEQAALARLDIKVGGEEPISKQVLERLGVPVDSIRVLAAWVQNTREEVQFIAGELERTGGRCVILVTSKPHTRRVRATWRALVGASPHAVVRYATDDPYDPARWWQQTRDALAVSREVFGLINVWAGFPVGQAR